MKSLPRIHSLKTRTLLAAALAILVASNSFMNAQPSTPPKPKVLFVVTSHDRIGQTGKPTGFYLSEVSHPWEILINAGYKVDFVSPQGGKAPVDGFDLKDPVNRKFWEDKTYRTKIEHTKRPAEVDPAAYVAIHFAGGHGAMWDLADNVAIAEIAARIYSGGGIVTAVCHGPAGLVNITLPNGNYLVDGKKVNAFTNEEEAEVKLEGVVPFLLESKLIERGALFEKSAPFTPHVVADRRLITGQNPQSAGAVGKALVEQLGHIEVVGRLTRFPVTEENLEQFKSALAGYVAGALDDAGNIQAEAYHERENSSMLWLIERWKNRGELARFDHSPAARDIEALRASALSGPAETYHVTDLEPLSKEQWRRPARTEDTPLTIMPAFRSQPGVVTYQLSQVEGDGTHFVTFEKFRSDEAFARHLKFPPIKPVIDYLNTSIKQQPFQDGLRTLIEFAPLTRESADRQPREGIKP
jgi:putative intracellular protease/amidase/quinol monooxygenase YgiN